MLCLHLWDCQSQLWEQTLRLKFFHICISPPSSYAIPSPFKHASSQTCSSMFYTCCQPFMLTDHMLYLPGQLYSRISSKIFCPMPSGLSHCSFCHLHTWSPIHFGAPHFMLPIAFTPVLLSPLSFHYVF